jgi:hypothetical protein
MIAQWTDIRERKKVAERHHLEKRIRGLERLPATPLRENELKRLRKELAGG